MLRRDVRRADYLPTGRAIDWEKAARWTKAKGARRVAKARMADMMVVLEEGYVELRLVFCGGSSVDLLEQYSVQFFVWARTQEQLIW